MPQEQSKSTGCSISTAPGACLESVEIEHPVDSGPVFVAAHQLECDRLGLVRGKPMLGQRDQFAIDPGAKHIAGFDMQV